MNNAETLPSELRMAAPPTIPQARSYLFKQKSEYTQYAMGKGTKVRINIPRLQRTYLSKDSYIRFRINVEVKSPLSTGQNVPCAPLFLDRAGAVTLFDRIEVYDYLGGTLIEQVNNLPALATMIQDLSTPLDAFDTKLEATQGCSGTAFFTNLANNQNVNFTTSSCGQELFNWNWNNNNSIKSAFNTFEFSIPIYSFLGLFSDKFVPLHNGFSVDFFLNSLDNGFISWYCCNSTKPEDLSSTSLDWNATDGTSTGGTYVLSNTIVDSVTITNFELCAQVLELGNDAENLVLASNGGGPLIIPSQFYRYFTDLVKGNGETDQASSVGMDLNLNVVSLRNIRFSFRPYQFQNNSHYPAYGHRIRNFLQDFNFQYGSSYLPELAGVNTRSSSIPVSSKGSVYPYSFFAVGSLSQLTANDIKSDGYTQSYIELLKTGKSGLYFKPSINGSLNGSEFSVDVTTANGGFNDYLTYSLADKTYYRIPPLGKETTNWSGKFMAGLDLRLSAKEVISGIDTNGLLVRLNMNFDKDNLSYMVNAVTDIYCEHDAFVQIIPGVATTATF